MQRSYNFLILFVSILTLATILSAITALAHNIEGHEGHEDIPGTTAQEADADKNDPEVMKNFLRHAQFHFEEAARSGSTSALAKEVRNPEGIWIHDSVYLIITSFTGRVFSHALYMKTLSGESLARLVPIDKFFEENKMVNKDDPVCEEYTRDGMTRHACAINYGLLPASMADILIAGFHHDEDAEDIEPLECPEYEPAVTAAEVNERQTEESLKDFVEGLIIRFGDVITLRNTGQLTESRRIGLCFERPGPWKDGSIYPFIMFTNTEVFVNGNDPNLTGTSFRDILDEDGVDIGKEIIAIAESDEGEGFVRYKWDDPSVDGDEVNEPGKASGTSPKITYVKKKTFQIRGLGDLDVIFGSGIYPKDDNDGCAIAGTDTTLDSIALNLFLILFSMFFVIFFKKMSSSLGKQ